MDIELVSFKKGIEAGKVSGLKRALELVGEYELPPKQMDENQAKIFALSRNRLRAELRTAISKELGGDNNV